MQVFSGRFVHWFGGSHGRLQSKVARQCLLFVVLPFACNVLWGMFYIVYVTCILRVLDQNGISQVCYKGEIYHSGPESLTCYIVLCNMCIDMLCKDLIVKHVFLLCCVLCIYACSVKGFEASECKTCFILCYVLCIYVCSVEGFEASEDIMEITCSVHIQHLAVCNDAMSVGLAGSPCTFLSSYRSFVTKTLQ